MVAVAGPMVDEYCPEIRADPPALDEVVRELDRDTKHIGRPTRSPRRPEWTADPFHLPSDARCVTREEIRGPSGKRTFCCEVSFMSLPAA